MTTPALRHRWPGRAFDPTRSPSPRGSRRGKAYTAVGSFLAVAIALNVGFAAVLDYGPRRIRDPEYGKRLTALKRQLSAHPGRPLVVVVGSSRTAMGVRPGVLADQPSGPMLFNMSLVGSGPVMQLITVRRMLADGIVPDAVLLEYWPAFLREDGKYSEQSRFEVTRLYPIDRLTVREYFDNPEATERVMDRQRLLPWYSHRRPLMNQLSGSWLPYYQRNDSSFASVDDWGWLPGHPDAPPVRREAGYAASGEYYIPLFQDYSVSPLADRAFRQSVDELRAAGVRVALVYLPESERFADFMPPAVRRTAAGHLAATRTDLDVPLIDCRGWVSDDVMPDGFHMIQPAAAEFTRKLAPAVADTFPELGGTR